MDMTGVYACLFEARLPLVTRDAMQLDGHPAEDRSWSFTFEGLEGGFFLRMAAFLVLW